MPRYQIKKYFEWGQLNLEPLQYILIKPADVENCWIVVQESTQQSIIVSKKAFEIQLKLGSFVQV